MIRYNKQYWGLLTLTRWYGSAFLRALPFSLSSALLAALLRGFWAASLEAEWRHPYPYQAFAFIAGFMVVFRYGSGCLVAWHSTSAPLEHCHLTQCSRKAVKLIQKFGIAHNHACMQSEPHNQTAGDPPAAPLSRARTANNPATHWTCSCD
jgi:hypothetical protein